MTRVAGEERSDGKRSRAAHDGGAPRGSRWAKILRRTRVGGTLAGALALLLWLAGRSTHGELFVLVAGAALLVAVVVEIDRMGLLSGRRLGLILLPPTAFVLFVGVAAIAGRAHVERSSSFLVLYPEVVLQAYRGDPILEVAFVLALALAAHGLVRLLQALALFRTSVAAVLLVGLTAFLLWRLGLDPEESDLRLRLAFAAVVLVAASSILLAVSREDGLRDLAVSGGLALWVVPPLPALAYVWHEWGQGGLVGLVVLAKIGDVAGYYVGNLLGRTHPFPNISPGKTTAGCVGSLVVGSACGALLVALSVLPPTRFGLAGGFLLGAIVNVAAQAGDLLESWVKRRAEVKDSSHLFGPSGGFLDLVDSLLLCVPAALLTWPWLLEPVP